MAERKTVSIAKEIRTVKTVAIFPKRMSKFKVSRMSNKKMSRSQKKMMMMTTMTVMMIQTAILTSRLIWTIISRRNK